MQIVDLVNSFVSYIRVILIPTWPRDTNLEYVAYRYPKTILFSHALCETLFKFKRCYMFFAISRLRSMYFAKSLEFIGDCCDTAIFRILRSVASL